MANMSSLRCTQALLFVLLCISLEQCYCRNQGEIKQALNMIKTINSVQNDWKAAPTKFTYMSSDQFKKLLGFKKTIGKKLPRKQHEYPRDSIPESFDAREQWSNCPSILSIKQQGPCGSCYAVSTASAFSDRICIASGGSISVNISAEYLMACATDAGDGCKGGDPYFAWKHIAEKGLPTGGPYDSKEGCQPYEIPPCDDCDDMNTPPCHPDSCTNSDYSVAFKDDIHYGTSYYDLDDVEDIQSDIQEHGPVIAGFDVYEDLRHYTSGVYHHASGKKIGAHAVRVIGWGVTDDDKKTPYWIVANSWGRGFGEDGTFRILRGSNECGFEECVTAGLPKV